MARAAGGVVADHVEALGGRVAVAVGERRAVRHREVGPRHLDHDDADLRLAGGDLGGREVAGRHVVVVPEADHDRLALRKQAPHLRGEDAEVGAGVGGGFGAGVAGQDVQHADAERTVLVLLAPHPRRQVHQRGERAVAAAQRPHAAVHGGIRGGALAHQADGGEGVARLLDGRLEAGARRVSHRVVVAGQRPALDIDRSGQVGGHGDEAVAGDVVHPLDHLGDGTPRAGHLTRLLEQVDTYLGLLAAGRVGHRDRGRLGRQRAHPQAGVLERIGARVDAQRQLARYGVGDLQQAVRQPLAEPVLVQGGHRHVDVGLELNQPLARVVDRSVTDAGERHPEAPLEGLGERDEVGHVHLHLVGMAVIADQLLAEPGDSAVGSGGPPALGGAPDHDHRAAVVRIPPLHRPHGGEDFVVGVAVVERQHVPAVGCPLLGDVVPVHAVRHHASLQPVVDAGVVVGQQDAQPLAYLLGDRLGLELLGMAGGHRELSLERHHLER